MTVTVVLADDHPIVRQGLRNLLESEPDIKVVGEAGNGIDAVEITHNLKPDVLVVDVMMPGLTGLEVVRQISQRSPGTRSIVLSMHATEAYVVSALKSGAYGYILKDTGPSELIYAVREVIKGKRYLSAPLSERIIDAFIQKVEDTQEDPYDTLTNREREILQLVVEGYTSNEIGKSLSISPRTVELHRAKVMEKLGLRNQADLIRFAIKRGILSLGE